MPRISEADLQATALENPWNKLFDAVANPVTDFFTEYRIFKVPLLNWSIITLYLINLLHLSLKFKQMYAKRPWPTTMLTNLLLFGLADTLAQTLRSAASFSATAHLTNPEGNHPGLFQYILEKGRPRRVILDEPDDDLVELGLGVPQEIYTNPEQQLSHPELFNFRRLALFSAWGFLVSFFQSPWYAFLNSAYNEGYRFVTVLQRVLADQLCYSPLNLACFFIYMAIVMERGDAQAVKNKLATAYFPTLAVQYCVWPAVQFINFLVVPSSLQIPFSSTVSVFWNAYLSLKNPT